MQQVTFVIPYYRAPEMLKVHLDLWSVYSDEIRDQMRLSIVDDCSPEPAEPVVTAALAKYPHLKGDVDLFRISTDIPWNRNGARNLGAYCAQTKWILHTDIDHLLPYSAANILASRLSELSPTKWYRFRRYRVGAADETRRKDAISPETKFGEIKPHGDSYLCTKQFYWDVGGYDEDYSGHLGGGTPFQEQMLEYGDVSILSAALHVYTRHVVPDASVNDLSRDTSHYRKLRALKRKTGNIRARNPLRFEWSKIL